MDLGAQELGFRPARNVSGVGFARALQMLMGVQIYGGFCHGPCQALKAEAQGEREAAWGAGQQSGRCAPRVPAARGQGQSLGWEHGGRRALRGTSRIIPTLPNASVAGGSCRGRGIRQRATEPREEILTPGPIPPWPEEGEARLRRPPSSRDHCRSPRLQNSSLQGGQAASLCPACMF